MEVGEEKTSSQLKQSTTVSNERLLENDIINDHESGKELSEPNTQKEKGEQSSVIVPKSDDPKPYVAVTVQETTKEKEVIVQCEPESVECLKSEVERYGSKVTKSAKVDSGDSCLKAAEACMEDAITNGSVMIVDDKDDDEREIETVKEAENEEKSSDKHLETDEEATMSDEDNSETELPKTQIKRSGRPWRKRKRGRKSSKATPKSTGGGRKMIDEDVCFICFDGGDLVLCDKRDCPKAYHPSCVNHDAAFFQTKGKWNCGWHLCSICVKKAEYMCYTCTFSLCKTCIKTNALLCVRETEKKGFCDACMKTVMLIEKKSQENQGNVDLDDKNSWEYLFNDYWTDTKAKLNISLTELVEAKNACKESVPAGKQEPPAVHSDGESESENPSENLESQPKKTRTRKSKKHKTLDSADVASEWASQELLEFVTHMGNDKSYKSRFDVQALLLEYIKTNKLRDIRRKNQIVCDEILQRLFGKSRVRHFEMLKLLESNFLIKEDDDIQGSVVDTERVGKDKKCKIHKKCVREPQSNRQDYAAVDIHNINLIYMRRKLVEDLLDDIESFNSKVVGTFVRIRTSVANNKQDVHRLMQVTGTTKGEHYAVGKKMTDVMLNILNLDKTESIPIDTISNQDFTEDECKRLRQIIKCGIINRPTVGAILDKAIELQAAKVNDWLETEVVRLSHLRDRASDLGRKKELRECVEKLEILKTPEERVRRLQDIPVVHDDPNMDPKHVSEDDTDDDDNKQDMYKSSVGSRFSKRRDYPSKESWKGADTGTSRNSVKNPEFNTKLSSNNFSNKVEDFTSPTELNKPSSANDDVALTKDISEINPKINEPEKKIWHYKDPSRKIQGPFSMTQLRKWNNNNYFPVELRIWKTNEKEDDGILLTDALEGRFCVGPPRTHDEVASAGNQGPGWVGGPHNRSGGSGFCGNGIF